ncbi:hypothetical protein FNF31_04495 [Cafeteria roenbergensis]|uniref:UBC core domain-containing protein n=1 Tax=Cafeteria roenbergensis TaxID=33653 RepID=A0A5A8D4S2_CAFRO|nr:hypothetical protein FNF31_04495 [Cafeteria roenbergensis]
MAGSGPNPMAVRRLTAEALALARHPTEGIRAKPMGENLFEWHYVLEGPKGTDYEGGWYWGLLRFKASYPMSPPAVIMLTPSGRFKPGERLCLSISDFHPESWQPAWGVEKVILGLQSFMVTDDVTYGAVQASSTGPAVRPESPRGQHGRAGAAAAAAGADDGPVVAAAGPGASCNSTTQVIVGVLVVLLLLKLLMAVGPSEGGFEEAP